MILCFPKLPTKDMPVVIETHDKVFTRLQTWLSANGKPPLPTEFKRLDSIYGLYKMADVDRVRGWARDNMYRGRTFGPDVPKELCNPEARDCDNIAEHYSYWFHRALPGCPVVSVTGTKTGVDVWHRYVFVVCADGVMAVNDLGFMSSFRQPVIM